MIHINESHLKFVPNYDVYEEDFPYISLDNREEFNILCPVSVVTGHRTSMQDAIMHLTNGNMELANLLIEDLQSTYTDERLPVSERLDLVKERLSTGSFAENDAFMHALSDFISVNYPRKSEEVKEVVNLVEKQVEKQVETTNVVSNS